MGFLALGMKRIELSFFCQKEFRKRVLLLLRLSLSMVVYERNVLKFREICIKVRSLAVLIVLTIPRLTFQQFAQFGGRFFRHDALRSPYFINL